MLFNLTHQTSETNYQLTSSRHVPYHLSKPLLILIISAHIILTGHVTVCLRFACDASACARSINGYCHSGQLIIICRMQIHSQSGNVIFELYLYSVHLQVSYTLTRNLSIHLPIIRVTTFTENICSSQEHASTPQPQLALSHFQVCILI